MIPKFLCPLRYVGVDYIAPVLAALGSDVDVMVTQNDINLYGSQLMQLQQAGVRFLPYAEDLFANYRHVFAEYHYLTPPFLTQLRDAGCSVTAYIHATDTSLPQMDRCDYFIAHSETVLRQCDDHTTVLWEGEVARFAVNQNSKAEAAFSGLFHLGEWETRRHAPRSGLREEMLTLLEHTAPVNRSLPLVVYYEDEYNDPASVIRGLRRLSARCTLLIKPWTDRLQRLNGPNIFTTGSTYGAGRWSAFLPRFAADIVMSGTFSGVGTTSVMLGLPYLPLHSQELLDSNNNMRPLGNIFGYYECHHPESTRRRLLQRIAPLHIEDTETLLRRIHDTAWWQRYHEQIPQWQKEIFGHYRLEGAAEYTATLLRSILVRGTMIPSSLRAQVQE